MAADDPPGEPRDPAPGRGRCDADQARLLARRPRPPLFRRRGHSGGAGAAMIGERESRRATGPPGRDERGGESRRATGPPGRDERGGESRRATGPPGRDERGGESRRATGPPGRDERGGESRRATGPPARDVVRYVGEPVALVVADDPYVALDALERVDVVYETLPACPSVRTAMAAGAPRLFPGTETNNVATITMRVGDADAALAQAAVVIRERFRYPRQTAAALETRGLVAVPPDPRGGELHLIGSTKCIHINRTILAPIFGIPLGALRLTEVDVGGGFGVRGELYPEDILVPLAAMTLGRPVKWIESRRENLMAANHAREVGYEIEIGFDADGRILAIRALIRADIGAYVRTAALVPAGFGAALLPGPYRVPNYACDLWSVVTNKTPAGTLRSPGRPECNFVRECLMDLGAARLGLDPAEIRRRNLIPAGEMPYDSGTKSFGANTVYDSGDYPTLFDELLRRLDYERARAEQRER